ncbi:MAG: D-glycero-beta-D-manno-heptose-7-phosphate kinase [Bdellovibrionales bacterium]
MYAHLHTLLEKLKGHRILCLGDVMLDRFIYGQVERVSPEAPIPVLRTQRESTSLGGSGNVVRNIASLGGTVDMIFVIGADQAGYDLSEHIAEMPEVSSFLITDNGRPTTVKTRFVANGQQLLRADHETLAPISAQTEEQILVRIKASLGGCDVVVLSDYAKGVLTDKILKETIALCREQGKSVLIDPKGRDFSRYEGATLLTPNRKELREATGQDIISVEDAQRAARTLIEKHKLDGVLAKLGGDGVCLVLKDQEAEHYHATAHEVFDVSGAGDTVVATMALALAGGLRAGDAAALSNIAGTTVVGKIGTATVTLDELSHQITHGQAGQNESKVLSMAGAAECAERWRKQGIKVGFTNGVFDLLHPGHLSLIRQARQACDRLIIGMNSDASVKRLKGESRPVQNEDARALVLASLADVDGVVIFEEDTPLKLIETVRPDLLVKGADYTVETVVGAELVQGWGGKVLLANLIEGQSTTSTISRIGGF